MPFFDGFAKVWEGESGGIIDRQGTWVIPPGHKCLGNRFTEGKVKAMRGERWGFLDVSNRWVVEPRFESVGDFSDGHAAVELDGKWGYVDGSDRLVIPPRFNKVSEFSEGLAAVWFIGENDGCEEDPGISGVDGGGAWGYIDRDGAIVIEPRFSRADYFEGGKARVRLGAGGPRAFIDRCGEILRKEDR